MMVSALNESGYWCAWCKEVCQGERDKGDRRLKEGLDVRGSERSCGGGSSFKGEWVEVVLVMETCVVAN